MPGIRYHSVVLLIMQLVAHAVLISMLWWAHWIHVLMLFLGYFAFSCLGTSIGYHRLFAHGSFESPSWFTLLCLHLGNLALVGSSISWVASHRAHHRYSDQNLLDTHSPHHHAWYHVVVLAMFQPVHVKYVKDLLRDHRHVLWHKHYFLMHGVIWIAGLLIAPTVVCSSVIAPQALTWLMGASLNWINHKWGYRSHETLDHSTNNWFYGLVYWGEGWHNNHHANPHKYDLGEQPWELDVSARIIDRVKIS